MIRLFAAVFAVLTALSVAPASAALLPDGFVYLADVAPDIDQDIRYATERNFTGAPVPGYRAAECILARPAAMALSVAQNRLAKRGLRLSVLDCYRPAKAVRHFVAWARRGGDRDPGHNPRVDRTALIAKGYIASRSGHSTGFTVDLTLSTPEGHQLDMGTPFDFFDPLAETAAPGIPAEAASHRRILLEAMQAAGFVNYSQEWWHYSLARRPGGMGAQDFDILPRGR
jgi:D-alanyl-D-alanine dipeptidase